MSGQNLKNSLRDWIIWESENDLHTPEAIAEAGRRNYQSPEYRRDRELRYAASRAWKELDEALEVAEAIDRVEDGEEIDFNQHFQYTENNRNYDSTVSNEEQLMDEFGFELADATLFALKVTTALESGFNTNSYTPNTSSIARQINSSKHQSK